MTSNSRTTPSEAVPRRIIFSISELSYRWWCLVEISTNCLLGYIVLGTWKSRFVRM